VGQRSVPGFGGSADPTADPAPTPTPARPGVQRGPSPPACTRPHPAAPHAERATLRARPPRARPTPTRHTPSAPTSCGSGMNASWCGDQTARTASFATDPRSLVRNVRLIGALPQLVSRPRLPTQPDGTRPRRTPPDRP
jgi:hypothetical protein